MDYHLHMSYRTKILTTLKKKIKNRLYSRQNNIKVDGLQFCIELEKIIPHDFRSKFFLSVFSFVLNFISSCDFRSSLFLSS